MIRAPEIPNVHCLCFDSATSQGKADGIEPTEAPSPASTSNVPD